MLGRALTAMFLAAVVSANTAGGGEKGSVTSLDLDAKVAALVEEALVEETEAQAFQKLEALGCPAVPAIVKHLDDRRKLPSRTFGSRTTARMRLRGFGSMSRKY